MIAENVIVRGEYLLAVDLDNLENAKKAIQDYLFKKGYIPEDLQQFYFPDRFLCMTYILNMSAQKMGLSLKFKRWLKSLTDEEIRNQLYFKELASKRKEIPFRIKVVLSLKRINDKRGIAVEITSTPAIYYQITQLKNNIYLNKMDYSLIRHENKEFIKEIMGAISAICLSEPELLSNYIPAVVSQKLILYKFDKIAKLLDEGKQKLELGENSTSDLIGVIENFLFDLISQLEISAEGRQHPEKNIALLKDHGYLSEKVEGTIKSALFSAVYLKLKDIDHKKDYIDNIDLTVYYGITESVIDYLLEKIIKYKIKVKVE